MKGVAFLQTDITDEKDIAGASRFFIDIFKRYHAQDKKQFRLFFLTDQKSVSDLRKDKTYVHCIKSILALKSPNNRLNNLAGNLDILLKIVFHRIHLIHICQYYHVTHYKRLRFLQGLPSIIRPKLAINWIHCNFPYEYFDKTHYNYTHFHERFDPLFNHIRLDGIFSWYELTKTFLEENNLAKSKPYIYPVSTYCCNTDKYHPAQKENIVVWAARLHKQKRADLYIEAVNILQKEHFKEITGWKFLLCGSGGSEESALKEQIKRLGLTETIDFRTNLNDMSEVFGRSKCFISTQDYENFTSLSMNEAMSAGNAIVSRSVGQTRLYVRDGENGFLAKEDSADGLAKALLEYITSPAKHKQMQDASVNMTKNIHSPANFMKELDHFLSHLLN